jgi:hypothetical protein
MAETIFSTMEFQQFGVGLNRKVDWGIEMLKCDSFPHIY